MAIERELEIRDIISAGVEKTLEELGLKHWRVVVDYVHFDIEGGFQKHATCKADFKRERALLCFDLAAMSDMDDATVMETVRHECMHMVHGPFDAVWSVATEMLNEEGVRVLQEAFTIAEELTVRNLERMYHSLTHPNGG